MIEISNYIFKRLTIIEDLKMNNKIKRELELHRMINEEGHLEVIEAMIQALRDTNSSLEMIDDLKKLQKHYLDNRIQEYDNMWKNICNN